MIGKNDVIEYPTETDVLFGRGVATNRHPGNENFRSIISQHVNVYVTSTKKQKMMISRSIVDKVRTQLMPPGRFLEKDSSTGMYYEVDVKKALEKTAQTLRDLAAPLRKQLSEDFSDPSFLSAVFDAPPNTQSNGGAASAGTNGIKPGVGGLGRGRGHHRRTQTAPARELGFPPKTDMPLLKKQRSVKPVSPVNLPSLPEDSSNFMADLDLSGYASPMALSPPLELSLGSSPKTPGGVAGKGMGHHRRHSSSSAGGARHRRLRTFGGYSCTDASSTDFLSKEDLMAGIPPLFASQLPEEARQSVSQALHPLNPGISSMMQQSPGGGGRPGRRQHRRYNTVDSFSMSQANQSPVFTDDPTLTFDFLNGSNNQWQNNTNFETQQRQQQQQQQQHLTHHNHSSFSAFELPQSLGVPELPNLHQHRPDPQFRGGRHHGGGGRHRRMHTTGDIFGGGGCTLEPVQEEAPPIGSIDSILNKLEPIAHQPSSTAHMVQPSSNSMEGILNALGPIAEHNESGGGCASSSRANESRDTSLSDTDFLHMLKSNDAATAAAYASDIAYRNDDEGSCTGMKIITPHESLCEPTPFAPNSDGSNPNGWMSGLGGGDDGSVVHANDDANHCMSWGGGDDDSVVNAAECTNSPMCWGGDDGGDGDSVVANDNGNDNGGGYQLGSKRDRDDDLEFKNAMGDEEHFLSLCSPDGLDRDRDVVFHHEEKVGIEA